LPDDSLWVLQKKQTDCTVGFFYLLKPLKDVKKKIGFFTRN